MATSFDESRMLMSSEAIEKRTGKSWLAWFEILDAWDGASKPHAEIARHLAEEHGVGGWDAQGVTVGYERARGLRPIHGNRDGTFEVSASKTYPVPVMKLFQTFVDDATRRQWLDPDVLILRTMSDGKSARFDQRDSGTILSVNFVDKGTGKSSVQIQEDKLPSKEIVDERRAIWKDRLAKLGEFLKGQGTQES